MLRAPWIGFNLSALVSRPRFLQSQSRGPAGRCLQSLELSGSVGLSLRAEPACSGHRRLQSPGLAGFSLRAQSPGPAGLSQTLPAQLHCRLRAQPPSPGSAGFRVRTTQAYCPDQVILRVRTKPASRMLHTVRAQPAIMS